MRMLIRYFPFFTVLLGCGRAVDVDAVSVIYFLGVILVYYSDLSYLSIKNRVREINEVK